MKNTAFIIALTFLALQPAQARADEVIGSVADAVYAAYGGKKLDAVSSYRMTGKVVARMRGTGGPMVRTYARPDRLRPDRLRVELQYPVNPETRILNGKEGWRTDPKGGGIRKVEGALLDSMVLQAGRAGIPWILKENREHLISAPERTAGGRSLRGLALHLGPGLTVRYYLEPGTNLVVFSEALLKAPGLQTAFQTYYSDFRRVGGIVFPYREENVASGFHTGTTVIEKVEINPADMSDEDFRVQFPDLK